MIRHFNWVHLAAGGPFAIATRNCLPAAHPLRRMLWPHMFGTQYSNELVTKGQMAPGGDFDSIFSLTHRGMCALFQESYEQYDLTRSTRSGTPSAAASWAPASTRRRSPTARRTST